MMIPIVDEHDVIIGYKERETLDTSDRYRVSALWITNPRGEILLAQRHHSKKKHPLLWGPAVAGTVEKGETYEENIIREAGEEIGLLGCVPSIGPKIQTTSGWLHFTQWFTLVRDIPLSDLKIQADEVGDIRWVTPQLLSEELSRYPEKFIPSLPSIFSIFR